MAAATDELAGADSRQIFLEMERVFDAPQALVFEMWIKLRHVQRWLGIERAAVMGYGDARLGGTQRLGMWSPAEGERWHTRVYREISPPSRLVFTHQWDGGAQTLVSISFEALSDDQTLMRFRQTGFDGAVARDLHEAGWAASFDNFGAYLFDYLGEDAKLAPTGDGAPLVLEIDRLFNAPRELVFKLWSSPEHIARWWGPKSLHLSHCEMDFRVGGKWHFCMQPPQGEGHWIHGEYREIRAPERLAFSYINDADGQVMLVELDFLAEGNKTRLKFRQAKFMTVTERNGHRYGWQLSFDIFARYIELYQAGGLSRSRLGWRDVAAGGDLPTAVAQTTGLPGSNVAN